MQEEERKLEPTFSMPGPGGSLGKCALCGECFLKEILLGGKSSNYDVFMVPR